MIPEEKKEPIRARCSKILYEDETFMIGADGPDIHVLLVNDIHAVLDRQLNEWAQMDIAALEAVLRGNAETVLFEIEDKNISLMKLGRVLALAVVYDLEEEVASLGKTMDAVYADSNVVRHKRLAKKSGSSLIGWKCAKKVIKHLERHVYYPTEGI